MLKAREIPANRLNYLRLLDAVSRPELDTRELEELIKREASLLYRLLRYLNSPLFAFATEIHSVRHALAILGEREARRCGNRATWCSRRWCGRASANCFRTRSARPKTICFWWG